LILPQNILSGTGAGLVLVLVLVGTNRFQASFDNERSAATAASMLLLLAGLLTDFVSSQPARNGAVWLASKCMEHFLPINLNMTNQCPTNNSSDKAAELDASARIWICLSQQTPTEALPLFAKNQQLSNAMPMGKQQTPPLEQPILFRSSTNPIQTRNGQHNNGHKFGSGRNGSKCGTR